MRQRSRFSKTCISLRLCIISKGGTCCTTAYGWGAAVPSLVGIEPPPSTLRAFQSAADSPPTDIIWQADQQKDIHSNHHHNHNYHRQRVFVTDVKECDESLHPAPCGLSLYGCNDLFGSTLALRNLEPSILPIQSTIAVLHIYKQNHNNFTQLYHGHLLCVG